MPAGTRYRPDAGRLPAFIEAALWFHDAIYDPRSSTNEEDSAALAADCFSTASLPPAHIAAIRQLILSTKTHHAGENTDAALLIDADLAICGQPTSRFLEYESGIKAEYAWVPAATYVEKRVQILSNFLERAEIYRTDYFKEHYEGAARTNLGQAISALGAARS
ncbi:MAG: hypothetical protein QM790_09845 [Nibricoccus sp.]